MTVLTETQSPILQVPAPPISAMSKAEFYAMFAMEHYNRVFFESPMSPWPLMNMMNPFSWIQGQSSDPPYQWMFDIQKKDLLARIKMESKGSEGGYRGEIPHISSEGITPETFRKYHQSHTPVVIEGFMKDTRAVKEWTLPWLRDRYGHERVLTVQTKRGVFYRGDPALDVSFGEGIDMMLRGERVYMFGCSNVLYNHKELLDDYLDINRLGQLCNPKFLGKADGKLDPFSLQLFVGGPKSGTSLHCASSTNMSLQVHGSKRWTLVSPDYTPYLYPFLKDNIYCDSPVDVRKSAAELERLGHDLAQFAPHFTAHLEPGDVLFNPGWWWHWVDNTSDTSLAVAHRFMSDTMLAGNPALQMMVMANFSSMKIFMRWMMEGKGATDADILNRLFPSEHES